MLDVLNNPQLLLGLIGVANVAATLWVRLAIAQSENRTREWARREFVSRELYDFRRAAGEERG
jgi:hypothetical protein